MRLAKGFFLFLLPLKCVQKFAVRLPVGFGWGSGGVRAAFGRRFSGVCFVSGNWFWIHKSASFYWISWGRACQNWCRIVIFRDRHFPKKCQKIKISKNKILIFLKFLIKKHEKTEKNQKIFLKALAGRAAADPLLPSPRRLENLLETATAAEQGAALIFHAVSEEGKMFSTFFHFCVDEF